MDISHVSAPPSPWPDRISRDLRILLLSVVVSFSVWFGGGWFLAGQVSTANDRTIDAGVPLEILSCTRAQECDEVDANDPPAWLPEAR